MDLFKLLIKGTLSGKATLLFSFLHPFFSVGQLLKDKNSLLPLAANSFKSKSHFGKALVIQETKEVTNIAPLCKNGGKKYEGVSIHWKMDESITNMGRRSEH